MTFGELFNISALDPLLPTFLIATLCLCALSVITYYSLALAWEVFWASRRSPSPLDPSTEVVLTARQAVLESELEDLQNEFNIFKKQMVNICRKYDKNFREVETSERITHRG